MSEETVKNLMRGYEAFSSGDAARVVELGKEIAVPDLEWGASGASIFPGVGGGYRGLEAVAEWMELLRAEWESFEIKLDEVLHDGDDVLVVAELLRGRGRESGVEVEMPLYSAYWFDHNGKLRRRASFTEPREALEAAGLSE